MLRRTYCLPTQCAAGVGVCAHGVLPGAAATWLLEPQLRVLGCAAGNLSERFCPPLGGEQEEVQSGSRRLVFSSSSMDLLYKLICPAK